MIRVDLDMTPLVQTRAGTARYILGLRRELNQHAGVEIRDRSFGGSARAWNVPRDALWYPFVLGTTSASADVLHCPTYRGPLHSRVPLVVTVHDLAVLREPQAFNRWSRRYGPFVVPRVVRGATFVIAVSEFTKREVVELLGVPAERVRVVPNGVEPVFTRAGPAARGDYVLTVGTLEPRKNVARVAEAAEMLGVELRVVGERGWGHVDIGRNGVRWLGRLSDAALAEQYRGARCVAYPSLYEGFGIPVLESMACGTPVVTSHAGATAEVADGAAVLVEPRDPTAIADGITQAVERRDELVARGLERARGFTWARAAEETLAVYREAVA
ncbi:MAG: glycosyltransferase family 4 protein [Gaiellaceae bacterium]